MNSNDNNHTANFLASSFLLSKRSLKNIYGLNPSAIAIIRYICDSIDLNYKKRKQLSTKLYQSQIAKYCHCSLITITRQIKFLSKKRLIKYEHKKCSFSIGKVLTAYIKLTHMKEVRHKDVDERYTSQRRTSNSSNISNKEKSYPQPKTWDGLAETDKNPSIYLKEFMEKQI